VYSPLGTIVSPPSDLATLPPTEHVGSQHKKFSTLYNFLCLKLCGHWTESHQISTGCPEMIADYSEIKDSIFQSVSECQRDEWRLSSNCCRITAKIVLFNSVNSEIIRRKFTKFLHDVAGLLPFNPLKVASWSAIPLTNAWATSEGHSWRHLRTSPIFNWLPWQHPFSDSKWILG